MPRVPRPDELPRASLEPANQPAQINIGVASRIGQSGKAMGDAISAIGGAFGEVVGRIGEAQGQSNYDNARLEWMKGDQAIQDDIRSNAGEDGELWRSAPDRYGTLNQDIEQRYPLGGERQRQFHMWREQNTFNRGVAAAREYQGAQRNQFVRGFDADVAGIEERLAKGDVDPTMFNEYYGALTGKLTSMNRTVMSETEVQAKTRELQGRLVGAVDRHLAERNPEERAAFWGQVKGGQFEVDRPAGGFKPSGGGTPMQVAQQFLGAHEGRDTKTLSEFFARAGGQKLSPADTAWCAAFVNAALGASGQKGTGTLLARDFLKFGAATDKPSEGDIVVMSRGDPKGWQGHVGFYAGRDKNGNVLVLGGNQGNQVSVQAYSPDKVLGFRRPPEAGTKLPGITDQQPTQTASAPAVTRTDASQTAVSPIRGQVTAYSPQRAGSKMEGGYAAARPGPDGKAEVRTLDDVASGRSKYITIAGSPSLFGKSYTIPKIEYQDAQGNTQVLENVRAVVHDTGSAFKTAPEGRFDIPIARDVDNRTMSANHAKWKASGIEFIPEGAAPANDNQGQAAPAPQGGLIQAAESTDGNDAGGTYAAGEGQPAPQTRPDPLATVPMGRLAPGQVFTVKTARGEIQVPSEWINALPERTRAQMSRQSGEQYRMFERGRQAVANSMIEDGEVHMAMHGKPHPSYDAATIQAAYTKNPDLLRKHSRRMQVAQAVHGELADMADMPSDEIALRMGDLETKFAAEGATDASTKRVMDLVIKRADALLKQRERDPAGSVDGSKEVRSVRERLTGGAPRNPIEAIALMDARMMAQARIEVPPEARSPISEREARALGQGIKGMSAGDALQSIQALHDRVAKQYGEKYSGLIVQRVIDTSIREKSKRDTLTAVMRGLDEDGKVSPVTLERIETLSELGRRERELAPTPEVKPPQPGIISRVLGAYGGAMDHIRESQGGAQPAQPAQPQQVFPKPSQAAIARLKKEPHSIEQYEAAFGPGSAEKSLPGIRRMLKLNQ